MKRINKISKKYRKFIILSFIIIALLCFALFDYLRAQDTNIEVVSISPQEIIADPNSPVLITLKITKRGKIATDDDVSALIIGQGNLEGDKVRVSKDGTVTFKYFPYSYIPGVFEESTVDIRFRNISDSIFIAIQKTKVISLDVKKSEKSSGGNMGDLFGE